MNTYDKEIANIVSFQEGVRDKRLAAFYERFNDPHDMEQTPDEIITLIENRQTLRQAGFSATLLAFVERYFLWQALEPGICINMVADIEGFTLPAATRYMERSKQRGLIVELWGIFHLNASEVVSRNPASDAQRSTSMGEYYNGELAESFRSFCKQRSIRPNSATDIIEKAFNDFCNEQQSAATGAASTG